MYLFCFKHLLFILFKIAPKRLSQFSLIEEYTLINAELLRTIQAKSFVIRTAEADSSNLSQVTHHGSKLFNIYIAVSVLINLSQHLVNLFFIHILPTRLQNR